MLYNGYVQKSNSFHIGEDILHHLYENLNSWFLSRG